MTGLLRVGGWAETSMARSGWGRGGPPRCRVISSVASRNAARRSPSRGSTSTEKPARPSEATARPSASKIGAANELTRSSRSSLPYATPRSRTSARIRRTALGVVGVAEAYRGNGPSRIRARSSFVAEREQHVSGWARVVRQGASGLAVQLDRHAARDVFDADHARRTTDVQIERQADRLGESGHRRPRFGSQVELLARRAAEHDQLRAQAVAARGRVLADRAEALQRDENAEGRRAAHVERPGDVRGADLVAVGGQLAEHGERPAHPLDVVLRHRITPPGGARRPRGRSPGCGRRPRRSRRVRPRRPERRGCPRMPVSVTTRRSPWPYHRAISAPSPSDPTLVHVHPGVAVGREEVVEEIPRLAARRRGSRAGCPPPGSRRRTPGPE